MVLLYLDTNIYLDYLNGRVDTLRPLGEFAFLLFKRSLACEFSLAVSSLLLEELYLHIEKERVQSLLNDFQERKKILLTKITELDKERARNIVKERKTPYSDTLHAIIAQRIGAYCVVTRNIRDFVALQDIIPIRLPENL